MCRKTLTSASDVQSFRNRLLLFPMQAGRPLIRTSFFDPRSILRGRAWISQSQLCYANGRRTAQMPKNASSAFQQTSQ
ncbi:hypothetical protein BAUCODRAFT_351066 [Baudoinia panamericana UAMH 10762]|uniref:Uncharacterized protein n=1 Tax=Baudoinia panamericana (strain UAMH 10762) TaxID=717646 RepID=M2NK36_BAUPA|nr:uncharacterized protein BAUCODRAFT_351066 [Baudoinia panamericana UAMH 10762]EMC99794.1 hypothetical protein BAUCODRAFT_351066 [Baudoinia panamericana UAMH 10762]